MERELILCIPGPWTDRTSFLRQVIAQVPKGKFTFVGPTLVDLAAKDHLPLEFCGKDLRMAEAFSIGGQGKVPEACVERVRRHESVLYLHFPLDLVAQRERLLKFTRFIRGLGGLAVKVETSGVAHTWEAWEERLTGSLFDLYCASVVLVGDEAVCYSCGMHHFGLPECAISREVPVGEAAELMNRFNFWQINDRPTLAVGETCRLTGSRPPFRLGLQGDSRHAPDTLFHNPCGVWQLEVASADDVGRNPWQKPEGEPLFVLVSKDDEKMDRAFERARATFPEFLAAVESKQFPHATNSVKIRIRDDAHSAESGEDCYTYLWLWTVKQEGEELCARVMELPKGGLNDLVEGQDVRFSREDVRDWMLCEGSRARGAYTMRVVREAMDTKERLLYDEYTGIMSYREIEPGPQKVSGGRTSNDG